MSGRDRGLLHENHVEEFIAWAEARGWERVPTKGDYEVLRLRRRILKKGQAPAIFHQRSHETPHYTSWGEGLKLAEAFIREVIRPRRRERLVGPME